MNPPRFSWPLPDDDVLLALEAAYRDGSWGKYGGPHVERLEARLAGYHEVEFALTCASGTFAVELALRALKIGPGDEVLLAAYDYPGNFLAVHAVGARPVLVDVDRNNWNLDPAILPAAVAGGTDISMFIGLFSAPVEVARKTQRIRGNLSRRLDLVKRLHA